MLVCFPALKPTNMKDDDDSPFSISKPVKRKEARKGDFPDRCCCCCCVCVCVCVRVCVSECACFGVFVSVCVRVLASLEDVES
jgi:hypothetical protein